MTKILCPSISGLNKCMYLKNGVCETDEVEMGWEIVAGSVLYYCMTEEIGE